MITDGKLDVVAMLLEEISGQDGLAPTVLGEIAAIRAILATVNQDIPAI